MASPAETKPKESGEAGDVDLHLRFTAGAAGAVSAIVNAGAASIGGTAQSKHFKRQAAGVQKAVSRTGVGAYDILLNQAWLALLDHSINVIGADTLTDGTYARLVTDNVSTAAAPKVSIQFYRRDTNAAADVKSGNDVSVSLSLKRDLP
jgi:hypothetical protein